MTRPLISSRRARAAVVAIFDFIAADNPRRAATSIEDIRQACRNLCETPHLGVRRPDLRPGLYILPLWRRIVVAYELPPGKVDMLRIFSAGQDYEALIGRD